MVRKQGTRNVGSWRSLASRGPKCTDTGAQGASVGIHSEIVSIDSLLPDAKALLDLEPEELAGFLLEHFNSLPSSEQRQLHRHNFLLDANRCYPAEQWDDVSQALIEAWVWLEREGLLVPTRGQNDGWLTISRRGRLLRTREDVDRHRHANLLPRQQLHPRIGQKVWATFLRGDYDTAVFQAFKEVEVRVREAGKYPDSVYGAPLMRDAFGTGGPLRNDSALPGEQQALSDLFAGAIGYYKNPSSHRNVTIEPREAVEMIMLASHLLGIVDKRSSNGSGFFKEPDENP